MRISELIETLARTQEDHGDLEVVTWDDAQMAPVLEITVEPPEDWRNRQKIFGARMNNEVAMIRPWVQVYVE